MTHIDAPALREQDSAPDIDHLRALVLHLLHRVEAAEDRIRHLESLTRGLAVAR